MNLRVATHNICHMGKNPIDRTELFPDKTYRNGYEADMVDLMKRNWKQVYESFTADLIGLQEVHMWFDLASTIRTEDQVFRPFGYELFHQDTGLAVASRFPLVQEVETRFEPVSKRRWQKFRLNVNGREIAIFNTHPTPRDAEIRQKEYGILIDEFRKEECFLAFGDFNAKTADEYEIFREAGFPMANDGIATVENGSMCDNIIVSPNVKFERVDVYDPEFSLSDHAVLYAEVLI